MLVYIAQEGVTTTDLFRRNGNPNDIKVIMKKLTEGKEVTFTNYNFYTLASVIKVRLLITSRLTRKEASYDVDNAVEFGFPCIEN